MPVDSVALGTLKEAVKSVLSGVSGIGTVLTRVGGPETWNTRPAPKRAFWEISVPSIEERGMGQSTQADELILIRVEGYMPWSYELNSEAAWDALLDAVRTRLRTYPTFGGLVQGLYGSGLPQLRANLVREYADEQRQLKVHYARIELEAKRHFSYQIQATL